MAAKRRHDDEDFAVVAEYFWIQRRRFRRRGDVA